MLAGLKQDVLNMGLEFGHKKQTLLKQDDRALAKEKLQKAIERNRQKQLKRNYGSRHLGVRNTSLKDSKGQLNQTAKSAALSPPDPRNSNRGINQMPSPLHVQNKAIPIDHQAEMGTAAFQKTLRSVKRKEKWKKFLLKCLWPFYGYLLIKLAISKGGAIDYYDKQNFLQNRYQNLQEIHNENQQLIKEINLIKNNEGHQKKLIREHLGFIDENEYLVLFSQEKDDF